MPFHSSDTTPLISVVVPVYNYADLLPRALDSVLMQWDADFELIVINDGSTDQTAQVLAEYVARYSQLKVINQLNAGAAAARNEGIRRACGQYVLLLDADDELLPDALGTLRDVLMANPHAGLVLGAHVSVYPDGRERLRMPTPVPHNASPRALTKRYLLDKKISISHCCTVFRRDLLLQRPYPVSLRTGEDVPVFAYLLVSAPVVLTQQPLARIHKHADSLRHSRDDEEAVARGMLNEVFASLPSECQSLRGRYEAQRYLSLFRAALLSGDHQCAKRYYCYAFTKHPYQALRWSYVKKVLRLFLRSI